MGNAGKRKEMVKDWRVQQGTRVWVSCVWGSCVVISCVWGVCVFGPWATNVVAGRGRKERQRRWWRIGKLKELRGTKLYVKDRAWQRKMVCEKIVCMHVCLYVMFCTMQPQILPTLSACLVAGHHPYREGRKDKGGGCHQVPRRPRKVKMATPATQSARSATLATQSGSPCCQVPRLPRKVTLDVAKCHAFHANSGGVHGANWEPSAPPEHTLATQSGGRHVAKCHAGHAKWRLSSCVWTSCVGASCLWRSGVCEQIVRVQVVCVSKLCVDKLCVQVVVWQLACWQGVCGQVEVACRQLCVDKLCVDKLCVDKLCVDKLCVDSCVWTSCVCGQVVCRQVVCGQLACWQGVCGQVVCGQVVCRQVVCGQVVCGQVGAAERRRGGGAEPKTRTPHKDVGKNVPNHQPVYINE